LACGPLVRSVRGRKVRRGRVRVRSVWLGRLEDGDDDRGPAVSDRGRGARLGRYWAGRDAGRAFGLGPKGEV
jgi:hypothetical protein